jgi:hypothetical protein
MHADASLAVTMVDLHSCPHQHVEVAMFSSDMVRIPLGMSSHELSVLSVSVSTQIHDPFLNSAEENRIFFPVGEACGSQPRGPSSGGSLVSLRALKSPA